MNWNRETLKGDFSLANSWFKDNREKVFLHRIVIGEENWIFYDNPKKKNTTLSSVNHCHRPQHQHHGQTFIIRRSCSVSGGTKRVLLLTMSCWNLAIPLRAIDIGYNWFVWAMHCEKNGRNTSKDMKIILLYDNAHVAKVVKKYLETLKWDVLPHSLYSPDCSF